MRRTRLLLADDHTIVAQGLVSLLQNEFEFVGTVADAQAPAGPTPRQREVLALVAEGRTMKQVAAALGLSRRTVETHKYDLMQALGVGTTAELIRYALDHGLVARAPDAPTTSFSGP